MSLANLGSLPGATIISKKFLEIYLKRLTPLNAFRQDFSDEVSGYGKAVSVNYVGTTPTAATVAGSANSVTSSTFTLTPITVTFGDPIVTQVEIAEQDLIKVPNPRKLEEEIARVAAYALAKAVQDQCFALILNANYSNNNIYAASAFNYLAYSNVLATGYGLGMPEGDVSMILSSQHLATLQNSQAIWGRTFNAETPAGAFTMDQGCSIWRNDQIPTNGENLGGFLCSKEAMVAINRALPVDSTLSYGQKMLITGENGATIRMSLFQDPVQNNKTFLRFETLFAVAPGLSSGLVRIPTA